jgi:hypothetical protein
LVGWGRTAPRFSKNVIEPNATGVCVLKLDLDRRGHDFPKMREHDMPI